MILITKAELETASCSAFEQVGVPAADAAIASRLLVDADLMGIDTHGVRRIPTYVGRLRQGVLRARPEVTVSVKSGSVAVVDGDDGLGPVVGGRGLEEAVRLAGENGAGFVTCRNSNHFGALAPYLRLACGREMICLAGTNSFPSMAPWGGREVKIGNNPLGVGAPRRGQPPFLLDIAMSVAARGKIRAAGERGDAIPAGWAAGADGRPTTDPAEALKGFVLPIGGHKGYGLALAVDLLAGVLSGGAFATGVKSMFQQASEPQHVAHFFIAINPATVVGLENYYDRMEAFCSLIRQTEPAQADRPVLLPGEIEARVYAERASEGIPLAKELWDTLRDLAKGLDRDAKTKI